MSQKPSERIEELVRNMQYFYPESESAALHMARQNKNTLDQIIVYIDEEHAKKQPEQFCICSQFDEATQAGWNCPLHGKMSKL